MSSQLKASALSRTDNTCGRPPSRPTRLTSTVPDSLSGNGQYRCVASAVSVCRPPMPTTVSLQLLSQLVTPSQVNVAALHVASSRHAPHDTGAPSGCCCEGGGDGSPQAVTAASR